MMKLSNQIIKLGEHMYRVYPFTNLDDLEHGNAYTFGGVGHRLSLTYRYVLPFQGKYKKTSSDVGIYLRDGRIFIIYPTTDVQKQLYSVNRIFTITPESIKTELDMYLSEVNINDLKAAGTAFEPPITEEDDTGIKAVRLALLAKQIDLNLYLSKLEKNSDRANYKKALTNDHSMTFYKLNQYSDIFEFNYGIIIFDKPTAKDPLSPEGKAIVIFNDDHLPLNDPNIEVIETIDDLIALKTKN